MQKMKNSRYDETFRLEVLRSSVNGYEKILEDASNGVKPVYTSKEWKEKNKWNEGMNKGKKRKIKGKEGLGIASVCARQAKRIRRRTSTELDTKVATCASSGRTTTVNAAGVPSKRARCDTS